MMLLRTATLVGILLALASPAHAAHRGGPGGTSTCSHSSAGYADGCAGASQSAQFINPAFFTNARESGQGAYATRPPWDVAGVDYPVGQITSDAGLIDFASTPPSGWSILANTDGTTYQNGGSVTVSGYRLNDVMLYKGSGSLVFVNNHITMGKKSCLQSSGTAGVNVQSGSADAYFGNNTVDTDNTCSWRAELYGTAYDPGLTQQFSANITIAGNALTVNSGGTGYFSIRQYLNWSGIGQQVRISANTSPGAITSCSGSACNGTTWTVCQLVIAANSGACNSTVTNVGPIAATTGPISPVTNAAFRCANVGGHNDCSAEKNYVKEFSTLLASGGGGTNLHRYNYVVLTGKTSDHDNLVANLIEPGSATTIPYYQDFNTVVWKKNSPSTGTTLLGTFLATNNTNKVGGYQMSWDPFEASYNTVVTNGTDYPSASGKVTASMWRALQQGSAVTTICNNSGNCAGSSFSGTLLTVASVVSGTSLAVGDAVDCGALCTWTGAVRIASFGTGTGGAGTYNLNRNVGSISSLISLSAYRYNGILIHMNGTENYFDATGALTNFIFDTKNDVGVCNMAGNVNLLTGATIANPCP
jgi:hypothetical protein